MRKFPILSEADRESLAVLELHRAMLDYKEGYGAAPITFYSRYLTRRLYAEAQSANYQKRKINHEAESLSSMIGVSEDDAGHPAVEVFDDAEIRIMLGSLDDNELRYCKFVLECGPVGRGVDADAARHMGVSATAISAIKKSLRIKIPALIS